MSPMTCWYFAEFAGFNLINNIAIVGRDTSKGRLISTFVGMEFEGSAVLRKVV